MLDVESSSGWKTLGVGKNYDTKGFVAAYRERKITSHVAQKKHSAIDGRTTRHEGYAVSLKSVSRSKSALVGWKTSA